LLLKGPPKSGETQQARTKRIKALCEVLEEKIALRYPIFKRSVYRIFRPAMPVLLAGVARITDDLRNERF
jgi:hypothetical protein